MSADIGENPRLRTTFSLNGTSAPSVETKLCADNLIRVLQNGTDAPCPPEKGLVEVLYVTSMPAAYIDKGYWTVRVEAWATDGTRITDMEGTVWVEGEREEKGHIVC